MRTIPGTIVWLDQYLSSPPELSACSILGSTRSDAGSER